MNTLWFMGVGFGVLLGWWLKCLVSAVQNLRDAREVRAAALLAPVPLPVPARRYSAKDILGYSDIGGRRVPPTHPMCASAATSAAALAAWERAR